MSVMGNLDFCFLFGILVRPGKMMTTSLALKTKIPNKKQKARFPITDITKQVFRKFHQGFNNPPYICYKKTGSQGTN